jgi:hypothetical protein
MPLYERLTSLGMTTAEEKISVHQFMAAIAELKRGKATAAQIHTAFDLGATEQAELATLLSKIVQKFEFVTMGAYNVLTNISASYDGTNAQRGLGFVDLDMTGVTSIDLTVMVNKVGTGTQSWQVWNETDASEIGVITDAAATGNKTLTASFTGLGLAGIKRLRMRAKSTVSTDDPVYYGGSLRINRLNTLSGLELHDVLLLAEGRTLPHVDTVAELKARLGV